MKVEPLGDHGGYLEGVVYAQTRLRLYIMRIISDYERMYGLASSMILEHLLMDTQLRTAWEKDSSSYLITQLTAWSLTDGLAMEHNIFKDIYEREGDNNSDATTTVEEDKESKKPKKKLISPTLPDDSRKIGSVAGWLLRGDTNGEIKLPSATEVKHSVEPGSTRPEDTLNRAMHVWCNAPGVYWLIQQVIDLGFHKSLIYLENQLMFQLSPPQSSQPMQQHQASATNTSSSAVSPKRPTGHVPMHLKNPHQSYIKHPQHSQSHPTSIHPNQQQLVQQMQQQQSQGGQPPQQNQPTINTMITSSAFTSASSTSTETTNLITKST